MKMNTLNITKKIMNQYHIRANKRFGQNFLIDDNILKNIIEISNIGKNDLVIEIGPGLGNLSEYIINNSKFSILIEIDKNMEKILNDRLGKYDNYLLLNEDVLKINIDELIKKVELKNNTKYEQIKVVANLPYYITTPIIFQLLQESERIDEIIVMVQKEVAERMIAKPKTKAYGILTIMVDYLSDADIKFIVPNSSFIPAPDVTSAVIKLIKNKKYQVDNEEVFFKLIHSAFAQRRKKLSNSLESTHFMGFNKSQIENILLKNNISLNVRAEELTIQDYINIVNGL
ncbi:MAG: 16S rRNA (adenine(1518)-N(6)/adenine(1519)-N(6))-dimethyltransferase RsmA [Clostridia bacterium]|nr:16S rRNA (adenine(1518)-N(6)/adenine(1519)-N(6))-dimethyltransferase RsmA [Clostridia bacterium]